MLTPNSVTSVSPRMPGDGSEQTLPGAEIQTRKCIPLVTVYGTPVDRAGAAEQHDDEDSSGDFPLLTQLNGCPRLGLRCLIVVLEGKDQIAS